MADPTFLAGVVLNIPLFRPCPSRLDDAGNCNRAVPSNRSVNNRQIRHARAGNGGAAALIVVALLIGLGAGGYYYYQQNQGSKTQASLVTMAVSKGGFDHIVQEQGEIESSSNEVITCKVKSQGGGGTAILWVIDEGTLVKKGDKLVELDASQIDSNLKQQRIVVSNASATVASQAALVEQAKIAREEYLQGVFKTDERV
ncbi:MAG: hypothetical protein AAFN70_19670, partial [Planctomycetota bacterium]